MQTLSTINSLLEKADKLYKQLQASKPLLETLLAQLSDHGPMQVIGACFLFIVIAVGNLIFDWLLHVFFI